jgi:hypothetical protein
MQEWFSILKSTDTIHHINRVKDATIQSTDAGKKTFDSIQYSFMIKRTLSELGVERNYFKTIKFIIYDKLPGDITLSREKWKAFPQRSRIRQGNPSLPLLFNKVMEVIEQLDKRKK